MWVCIATSAWAGESSVPAEPFVVVLGVAQDGGAPQAGTKEHPGWSDEAFRKRAACIAIVDPASGERWMFDATPDFKWQLHALDGIAPEDERPGVDGIFLTHAHIGHYTGLMLLGHEAMGAREVPVYCMPRMAGFLSSNGPWDQLVRYGNVVLKSLAADSTVRLSERLSVTPLEVPHRQEYSEVVGYRIDGPTRSVLFMPDIDSWEAWDEAGTRIEDVLRGVDVAYVDGTFFANGEIPGRDMSGFPHPFITHTMARLGSLHPTERSKVRFIHLNHTNPVLRADSDARTTVESAGFRVAEELERFGL